MLFGGVEQVKEECRDVRPWQWVDGLWRDLHYALRGLRRDVGFTAAAVLALALGLGVNTMQFTVVNAHTIRELPIDEVERVLDVSTRDARDQRRGVSYRELEDIRGAASVFEGLVAVSTRPVAVGDDNLAPERAAGAYVSADVFRVLRDQPVLGRGFDSSDEAPGAPAVVVLGDGLWRDRYGAAPSIIGQRITINGEPATVIGVTSEGFRFTFPASADLFLPLSALSGVLQESRMQRALDVFGRLRQDATLAQARGELETIAGRLTIEYPETNSGIRLAALPISERYLGNVADPAWMAFMTAGVVLVLIACANVGNLLMMRCT